MTRAGARPYDSTATRIPNGGRALAALMALSACAGRPPSSERTNGGDDGGGGRAGDARESAAPVPRETDAGSPQTSAPRTLAQAAAWPFFPTASAACLERPIGANTPPAKASVADVVVAPRSIAYESDAFVVMREPCHLGPKQTGAACRPFVVLSDTRYAGVKQPMSPSLDLVVFVDDLQQWELFARYRARYVPCSGAGALAARVIDARPLR